MIPKTTADNKMKVFLICGEVVVYKRFIVFSTITLVVGMVDLF